MIQYFILFFSVKREPASVSWTKPGGAANKSSLPNLVYSIALFNLSIINASVSVLEVT